MDSSSSSSHQRHLTPSVKMMGAPVSFAARPTGSSTCHEARKTYEYPTRIGTRLLLRSMIAHGELRTYRFRVPNPIQTRCHHELSHMAVDASPQHPMNPITSGHRSGGSACSSSRR
jgi:hypothetical protein